MKLDLQPAGLYPLEICTYCANEISNLMKALRGMYGLRRVPLITTVILLSASTVHLLNLPSQTAAVNLIQALHDLRSLSVNHRYASSCVEILIRLANQWGITLPEAAQAMAPFRSPEPPDFVAPHMSVYFTQAALSNESIDTLSGQGRHDSGSIYEPSFVQHNYPIFGPQFGAMDHMQSTSSGSHTMHSTPVQTTPVIGAQGLWSQFSQQQIIPSDLQNAGYDVITNPAAFGFNPYGPPA